MKYDFHSIPDRSNSGFVVNNGCLASSTSQIPVPSSLMLIMPSPVSLFTSSLPNLPSDPTS